MCVSNGAFQSFSRRCLDGHVLYMSAVSAVRYGPEPERDGSDAVLQRYSSRLINVQTVRTETKTFFFTGTVHMFQASSVNLVKSQKQEGVDDCGPFATATATSLAHGASPGAYVQSDMRQHLVNCLESGVLTLFPCNYYS